MEPEVEAKFLDIDPHKIREQLKQIGAQLIHPERLMKRKIFDYPDKRLAKEVKWIRLRDEGDKVTLTYKHRTAKTVTGTSEIEVVVSDFDKTEELLVAIGLKSYIYFETKREEWKVDNTMVTIDSWPWIPTYVEIESNDEKIVQKVAKDLNFDYSKAMFGSSELVYMYYYDVNSAEVNSWGKVVFSPVPDWLEKKKRFK